MDLNKVLSSMCDKKEEYTRIIDITTYKIYKIRKRRAATKVFIL
jgi:hypothetical protein